eukprot:8783644-Pyramimonas_sp.AAC.1
MTPLYPPNIPQTDQSLRHIRRIFLIKCFRFKELLFKERIKRMYLRLTGGGRAGSRRARGPLLARLARPPPGDPGDHDGASGAGHAPRSAGHPPGQARTLRGGRVSGRQH